MRAAQIAAAICVAAFPLLTSCATSEEQFSGRRLENVCDSAIPVCRAHVGCVLGASDFYRGAFPGGFRVAVRTETERTKLTVRILLTRPVFAGSEIHVTAYDASCGDFDEKHPRDRNLFDLAGNDGILDFELEVDGRGDHLVEVFSDMGSEFLMTIDVE